MYLITIKNGSTVTKIEDPDDESTRLSSGQFCGEVNQIPSFSFTVSPANPCWESGLNDRKTQVTITNTLTNETEFEGTLLKSSKAMDAGGKLIKTALCEGFLGYLCDSVQMYKTYTNTRTVDFLSDVLARHNAQAVSAGHPEKQIYLGSCNVADDYTNSKTTAYRNTLTEIRINLIERLGGEIRIRKANGVLYLDYLDHIGHTSQTTIELAKNMKSLEAQTDTANIITRLIPLGAQTAPDESAERVDITSVNSGLPYIDDAAAIEKYGIIAGTVEFDDITQPANLKTAGQQYLANNNRIRKAYKAQVLDLSLLDSSQESFREGNTYHFKNAYIGLDEDLRVMKRTVDIHKPYSPVIEIGDKTERITDISVRTARLIEYDLPQQKLDILASARATASSLINAGISGYVVVNSNEILIMDTPDKATAAKVWRWNSGGFGYSSTGYNGTYATAMTMDGAIVADFITAGILRGMEILNGNGRFHVHADGSVDAQAINITGGSINITTATENYDVISLNCGGWTHELSPLQWQLMNSGEDFSILAQAGGMYFKYGNVNMLYFGSRNGNITAKGSISADGNISGGNISAGGTVTAVGDISSDGEMICDDLKYYSYGTQTRVSLADRMKYAIDAIADLQQRVAALEGQ